jgi:hypothetical protein
MWSEFLPVCQAQGRVSFPRPGVNSPRHPKLYFASSLRDHLLASVWGDSHYVDSHAVDVYVRRLREKIDDPENLRYLRTVRSAGYRFDVPRQP